MPNDTLSPTLYAEGEPQQPSTPAFTDIMPPMRSVGSFGDPEQAPVVASPAQPDGAYSIAQPYLLPPYRPMASVPDYPLMGVYSQLPTTSATINYPSLFTPGYMVWQGEWQDGFQYNVDDVVYQNVSTYIAIQANNNNPPDENVGTYWQLVGENFNYRGEWAANPLLNVQNAHASGGSQTFTCAYGSPVTAGNWLYAVYQAFFSTGTTSNVPSVTDSLGNSWVQLGSTIIAQGNSGNNVLQQAIFGCQASFSGANTVTFTGSNGTSISSAQGNVFEYGELLVGGFGTPSFATASIFTGGIGQDVIIPDEGAVLISASFSNLHNASVIGFDPSYFTKQNSNGNTNSGLQLVTGGGYEAAVEELYAVTSNQPETDIGATAHIVPLEQPTVYNTEYNPFDVVLYLGSTYVCIFPTNSNPIAGLGTSWLLLARGVGYSAAQTGAYTAVATDSGTQQNFTISTGTTFKLPAAIPDPGWVIWVMNNPGSTAALTVSPNGLLLDGSSGSYTLSAGSGILIFTDGTNYFTQRSASINAAGVNAQTGTTYTFLATDLGKLVTFTNTSAIAATLPVASTTGFGSTWYTDVQNIGAVGHGWVTITPTTSTIDGAATLVVQAGSGTRIFSDGTNYFTQRGAASLSLDDLVDAYPGGGYPRSAAFLRQAQFSSQCDLDNADFQASSQMIIGAPPGWFAYPSLTALAYNTATPYAGTQSLQITGVNNSAFANRAIAVNVGETYQVSGWIKTDGTCTADILFLGQSATFSGVHGDADANTTASSWTYVTATATITAGGVVGQVICEISAGTSSSVASFDNIRICRIFGASGTYHQPGLVPDPGGSSGTTRFLREDASWQTISTTPGFDTITSGTNTSAAMVLGSGSSLTVSGTGSNNATAIDGVTVTGTPTANQVLTATSGSAGNWQTVTATAVNAIPLPNTKRWAYFTLDGVIFSGSTSAYASIGGVGMSITNPGGATAGFTQGTGAHASAYSASGTLVDFVTSISSSSISKPWYVGNNNRFQTALAMLNSSGASASTSWWGYSDQTPTTMAGGANPAGNYVCFRFIQGTDTNIQCITKDGTTQTVIDSGVAPTAGFLAGTNTMLFEVQMHDATPNALFYINGALVATSATHLPASTTAMNWQATSKGTNGVNIVAVLSYVYFESDH